MNPETNLQNRIRLAASQYGTVLFRNNCGKLQDNHGRWVQFGVGSPGGADLIGWTTRNGIAIFVAIEVKVPGGKRSPEQIKFIDAVIAAGGIAGFVESVSDAEKLLCA